jgi:hypothetical protein
VTNGSTQSNVSYNFGGDGSYTVDVAAMYPFSGTTCYDSIHKSGPWQSATSGTLVLRPTGGTETFKGCNGNATDQLTSVQLTEEDYTYAVSDIALILTASDGTSVTYTKAP